MNKHKKLIPILFILILFSVFICWLANKTGFGQNSDSESSKENSERIVIQVTSKPEPTKKATEETSASVIKNNENGTDLEGYTIIMHTNDTHGRVDPNKDKDQMGFTAVSALKKSLEAAGAEVILLDAGDTLHGTDFAKKDNGKRIVALMNLVGYDAMVPGNNDFNYGTDTLLKRAKKMNFALLSANITYKDNGENLLEDSIIIEKNGVKYGIFGLTTTDTVVKEDPKDIKKILFKNPVTIAKEEVDNLKAKGADTIIALAHLGVDTNSEFTSKTVAEQVDGINLIVDGHSHTAFHEGLPVNNTLIVSAGQYIEHIGVVTISPNGNMKASLIDPDEFTQTDSAIDEYITMH